MIREMRMNNKSVTVCFSGHRILKDPKEEIEAKLEAAIRQCIGSGSEGLTNLCIIPSKYYGKR